MDVIYMKKITIRDIAREAGVSISTVSNALNHVDVLSDETKRKVFDAAEKLNYIPNLNGKFLRSRQSKMIGFFTTSLSGWYFNVLIEAISRECDRQGYGLQVIFTRDKEMILSHIFGERIDGVILFEENFIHKKEIQFMQEQELSCVFLDRAYKSEKMSSIVFDSYQSAVTACEYLIGLGHRKIGFISGSKTMFDSSERFKGYCDTMKRFSLAIEEKYLLDGLFEEHASYIAVKAFLHANPNDLPDAFIAGNDLSAIGCMKALQSQGYCVPQDISVLGFDDIDIAPYFSPALTTLKNPVAQQGTLAVQKLLSLIQTQQAGEIIKLDSRLVVRSSCDFNSRNIASTPIA